MGLTRQIGRWSESIRPEGVNDETRRVVSGLIALALTAAAGSADEAGSGGIHLGADPLSDAHALAAGVHSSAPPGAAVDPVNLAAPVLGATLALTLHRSCPGSRLVAAIAGGCEAGLMLSEMAGDRSPHPSHSLSVVAAALGSGLVLGLDADRLVSAMGVGVSSSVGASVSVDPAWQAGKSASNGVLAALLAGSGFTGPDDAIEHPRGLFGAVLGIDCSTEAPPDRGGRIVAMEALLDVAACDPAALGAANRIWEADRAGDVLAALTTVRPAP